MSAGRALNIRRPPKKPCVPAGMTGLPRRNASPPAKLVPKQQTLVRRYGRRLLPKLHEHLDSMPFEAAAEMERDLGEGLRRAGFTAGSFRWP